MSSKKYQNTPKKNSDSWPKHELFLFEPKTLLVIIVTSFLTLLVAFFGERGAKFMTSVLSPIPEHAPFDGTVYPVQKVPNWVQLTEAERKAQYGNIPQSKFIPTPNYNPTRLAISTATLQWNNDNDNQIRNEKITYSVPYLGNYKLDGLENVGSHPAVDIKVPEGTPVHAISNGTVIKSQISSGGFGNHIVIQHSNVPSLDDPNLKETIFSSYSHMKSLLVNVNDVVTKGQLIGFSGMTGTATTPHIHFQIDKESAPWHPYWPFNSSDMNSAGYSFFEAINNGLRQDNALTYTMNPMRYVQKYLGEQALVASAALQTPAVVDPYKDTSFVINTVKSRYVEGEMVKVVIQAFDATGILLKKPNFQEPLSLSLLNNKGVLSHTTLNSTNFKTGISSVVRLNQTKVGTEKILLRFRDKEFSSPDFEIAEKSQTVSVAPMVAPTSSSVQENAVAVAETMSPDSAVITPPVTPEVITETVAAQPAVEQPAPTVEEQPLVLPETPAVTSDPAQVLPTPPLPPPPTPAPEAVVETPASAPAAPEVPAIPVVLPFSDITGDYVYLNEIIFLKEKGLAKGYSDGTFQPDREVSRAEAITFILRTIQETASEEYNIIFPDVAETDWYANHVFTAHKLGFVKGYPDGYFRPNDTVNLVEFLTMLFLAAKIDVDPTITTTLPQGIIPTEWFAPYIQQALQQSILEPVNALDPDESLTRQEVTHLIYNFVKKVDEQKAGAPQ